MSKTLIKINTSLFIFSKVYVLSQYFSDICKYYKVFLPGQKAIFLQEKRYRIYMT